jgi:tetratricopeptide (TPR) repeat protein
MRTIFIAILVSILYTAVAQPNQEVLSLIVESKIYFEREKFSDALIMINEALTIDGNNAEAHYIKGNINFAMNKYQEADKDYTKALQIKNAYPEALSGKILALAQIGSTKEALELAENAIKGSPSDPLYHYSRGMVHNAREKYAKAIDDFDNALKLQFDDEFKLFLYRGVAKLNLGEFNGAKEDLDMAIETNGKSASAYHSRGRVHYELREYEMAIKDFETSLNFNPKNEVAYYNLGMTYYRMDNMERACKYFFEACGMKYEHACKMSVIECGNK